MNLLCRQSVVSRRRLLCFILMCVSGQLISCKDNKFRVYSHPRYFDSVLSKAKQLEALDPQRSLAYLDSSFVAFAQPGIKDLYRKYMFTARTWDNRNNFQLAETYYDSALWVIRGHDDEKEFHRDAAAVFYAKGYTFFGLNDYQNALKNYNLGRRLAEELKDSCLLSTYTFMQGNISDGQGRYLDAARFVKQGIAEAALCDMTPDAFKMLCGKRADLGFFYGEAGMPDSALYYLNSVLGFIEEHNHRFPKLLSSGGDFIKRLTGDIYANMGTAYLEKSDTATAEQLFTKSLSSNAPGIGKRGDVKSTCVKLATIYLAQNKLDKVKWALEQLRGYLDLAPRIQQELSWCRLYIMYLSKSGQTKEIPAHTAIYFRLQDSLEQSQPNPHAGVHNQYENYKNEYDLIIVKKENEIKNLFLVITICITVLIIFVAYVLWSSWQKTRKMHTQASEQNAELRTALSGLEQSQKENTRIMKIVAHDLREPVGGITTLVNMMMEEPGRSAEDRELLELMWTAGKSSLDLVGNMLQMQSTLEDAEKKPVDLDKLVRSCIELLRYKAEAKEQQIVAIAQSIVIYGSMEKLWRVMSNLISNAIKFSPKGSSIVIRLVPNQESALISIRDHGIGIPAELGNHIFDMFTAAKRPGTAGEQAHGLGLAISKQIVEAHGGKIWFESKEERGTIFYVELPVDVS